MCMGRRNGGVSMMSLMFSDRLGDGLELLYKSIYSGGGIEFGVCIAQLMHMLGKLADAGMITNITRKRVENFFSNDMTISDMKVISRDTSSIVIVNKRIHQQDAFELSEFITWITDELIKDPIMKKTLCGRDNYEGLKTVLNSYGDERHEPVMKESWVDFHIHQGKVFFTKRENDEVHLYVEDIKEKDEVPFLGRTNISSEAQLVEEDLLDGRIYYFSNGTVFVETKHGYIVRISELRDSNCRCRRIEGVILGQLEDESLLYLNHGKIIQLGVNGKEKIVIEDAILGMFSVDGNEVYWKSRFRKKELKDRKFLIPKEFSVERIEDSFKWEKVNEEILWKSLLFTLYDFDSMEFVEKLGNRLRFSYFFDKLPMPFTVNEILNRLSEIEEYCYEEEVIKSNGYVEAMSCLMSLEKNNLDVKATFNALTFLLDNVKCNPYDTITDSAGIGVISSVEFLFGDVDEMKEMDDEVFLEEDMDELWSSISNFDIEEMKARIDRKIAEIDKAIENEECKEREAEQAEKTKKNQNMKKEKERQDKGRRSENNGEKVERSAGGVNKNTGG